MAGSSGAPRLLTTAETRHAKTNDGTSMRTRDGGGEAMMPVSDRVACMVDTGDGLLGERYRVPVRVFVFGDYASNERTVPC
ncbi:hypothetical protein GCM10023197_05230 [Gordonia humi]